MISSDTKSNQLEITIPKQDMNDEEGVCDNCSTGSVIENPVCEKDDSDDEIPELVYIPELTQEEEEAEVQKIQKYFDKDTLEAIKLPN